MGGELNDGSRVEAMLSRARLAQPVRVTVEEYRLSHFMVIHAATCRCGIYPVPRSRRVVQVEVAALPELLLEVWPHEFLGESGYDATVRRLATRTRLGDCQPRLIIPPALAPLMRQESPVAEISVMVCPDATGKQIVHDPYCEHTARVRASRTGSGTQFVVDSLHALVPLVLPGFPGPVEEVAASEFEVKDCVRNLPTAAPVPVSMATKLQVARRRAYSALVALYSTAHTVDAERARGAAQRLEQRLASTSERRRQGANLMVHDVWQHLVAASEAACWLAVRQDAEGIDGWEELDDQGKADRWVKAALGTRERYRKQEESGLEDGGTVMGHAFAEAAREGVRQFRRQANDALHEVDELRRKAADAAG